MVRAHRAWMLRNYALTLLALTARVLTPLMLIATARAVPVAELIPIGQVAGWVVNLAVAEVLIRRAQRRSSTTRSMSTPSCQEPSAPRS